LQEAAQGSSGLGELKRLRGLKKRGTLGKVSPLGYIPVLYKINLSRLIGGKSLIILYTILKNKITINIISLANIRISGFLFININFVKKLINIINLEITKLLILYPV
jgi:hypothetical protein